MQIAQKYLWLTKQIGEWSLTKYGFPLEFIEEVKQRNDIISVISRSLTMKKQGRYFWACCPFHYEKTPSFAVSEDEQYFHCYGCGEGGDVIRFVMKYDNIPFYEAVKKLAESAGMQIPNVEQNDEMAQKLKQKKRVLECLNCAKDYYIQTLRLPTSKVAQNYVISRQFTGSILKNFGIGYSPDWTSVITYLNSKGFDLATMRDAGLVEIGENGKPYDVFAHRLMFPIIDIYGDCIGFSARVLEAGSKFAKYRNSTQTIVFDKSKTVYNINMIKELRKEQPIDSIIICEGQIDVIAMFKAGYRNACACMGTAITPFHARLLKRYADKVILCLDGDGAGQKATYKATQVLADAGLEVRVAKLRDGLDPDEILKKYGKEELDKSLENLLDHIEYKIESLATKYNLKDNYERNKFVSEAMEVLSTLESNTQKDIYLKLVSAKANVPVDVLRRDLRETETGEVKVKTEEQEPPVRIEGHTKAIQFVLSSIVHKEPYAMKACSYNIKFQNPSYQKLFDYLKSLFEQNKTWTVGSLYDVFDVDEDKSILDIINFNFFNVSGDKQKYFDECLENLYSVSLKQRQDELMRQFKTERDATKRRQIAGELGELAKELKNNGDKQNV